MCGKAHAGPLDPGSIDRPHLAFGPGVLVRWTVRLLALVAAATAAYLAWGSVHGADAMIGCGGSSLFDCSHVLASRWSYWWKVPVSLPATAVYAAILAASLSIGPGAPPRIQRVAWALLILLVPMAAGAALWFLVLLFVIGKLCLYCLIVHGCGLSIAGLVLSHIPVGSGRRAEQAWMATLGTWAGVARDRRTDTPAAAAVSRTLAGVLGVLGCAGTATLIAGQVLFPPQLYRMEIVERKAEPPRIVVPGDKKRLPPDLSAGEALEPIPGPIFEPVPEPIPEPVAEPVAEPVREPVAVGSSVPHVTIFSGDAVLNTREHPILGDPEAKHVVVNLFDYTCEHCRTLHRYLEQARQRYGDQLAIIVLPVPMNTDCNPFAPPTPPDHQLSCEYAELALAVWAIDRSVFEPFHEWLLKPKQVPPLREAADYAARLVGQAALDKFREGPSVRQQIRRYTGLYQQSGGGRIPKILWDKYVITGHTANAQQLFDLFEREMNLQAKGH